MPSARRSAITGVPAASVADRRGAEQVLLGVRDRFVPTIRGEIEHRDPLVDREPRIGRRLLARCGQRDDGLLDVAVADLAHRGEQLFLVGDARARREHLGDVEQSRGDLEPLRGGHPAREPTHERPDEQQARAAADADRTDEPEHARRVVDLVRVEPEPCERRRCELHDAVHPRRIVTHEVNAPVARRDQDRDQGQLVHVRTVPR